MSEGSIVIITPRIEPPARAPSKITLSVSNYSGDEDGLISFLVERFDGFAQTVTVDWTITGVVVTPNSGTVTFFPGEGSKRVWVTAARIDPPAVSDPVFPEEHFTQVSVNPGVASLSLPINSAMLVIGMSNTNQYTDALIPLAGASKTTIVNGAQGGAAAAQWAISSNTAWTFAASQVSNAGFTADDVSVVFIGIVDRVNLSESVAVYVARLDTQLRQVVLNVRQKYPSAIMIMNGLHNEFWATSHPEPHAWWSSSVAADIIADNVDVYWGPYIWNPEPNGRSGDGFNITEADHEINGNVHLTAAGSLKVANSIMTWFQVDSIGRSIFF